MPSHRNHSITTLLAVAGSAALVALLMNRHATQARPAGRRRPGSDRSRDIQRPGGREGFAAISRAAAAEAPGAASDFVRPAGPESMRDAPRHGWDRTDEASDESFPASDPPATY